MGTIKDLPIDERPREKALQFGIDKLSDNELLALLIGKGTKNKSALEIAMELILVHQGIEGVFKASIYELVKEEGINKVKALEIKAMYEVLLRLNKKRDIAKNEGMYINSTMDVFNYLYKLFDNKKNEQIIVLYLNIKNKVLHEEIISIGDDSHSINNNKLICKNAIELYAKKVIVAHNHPSGNATPSFDDVKTFLDLKKALSYVNVKLIDQVIIGKKECYSHASDKKINVNAFSSCHLNTNNV